MHEVITLSCSQSAGHVATQLYNVQESHIPYLKSSVVSHHNNVFLNQVRINGRSNYYPRHVSVQYSGGFGGLGKYDYSEKKTDPLALVESKLHIIDQKCHTKNEYQENLDSGLPTSADLLTAENTKYWTDYNKLIYKPQALIELQNFREDGTHRNFPRMTFTGYSTGQAEFSVLADTVDDVFRRSLENADSLQGINFLSEVNNAWGSFTNDMIQYLKDQYFNNGAGSKHNLWVYGFCRDLSASNLAARLLAIKNFSDFARNSTLFFPMQDPQPCEILSADYDPRNLWHLCAVQSIFINSIWSLNCSMQNQVKMATIESNFLRGYEKRNVVNEIRILLSSKQEAPTVTAISDIPRVLDLYATGAVAQNTETLEELNLGICTTALGNFSRNVVRGPSTKTQYPSSANIYENCHMDEILHVDSFPKIMQTSELFTEFGASSLIRDKLKKDRELVSKARLPEHVEAIGGDRGELIEELSELIDEYREGYSDESDYE